MRVIEASSVITTEELLSAVKLPLWDEATRRDAAAVLGVGRTQVYALAKSGELPTLRLGRRAWVSTATLRRLLDGAA